MLINLSARRSMLFVENFTFQILYLDECTANVDTQTALLLQSTISIECNGMAILTIAHCISTVLKMDNILVLDHGILVEQGNPQDLLNDECSRLSSYAKASTMPIHGHVS
ncbi:ABC transporter C family member 13 [Ananas comosus]|uniref:ABC transporter C family member 13 n=1 Tax=Ananas comosus TaxID=4615 RepID=A0A199VLQ1_ANACO|nr:ABC transporter C family member 13 [Ananas comosus]